jgi:peptidoglycan/LPS O-acetylase OafA/YrhL
MSKLEITAPLTDSSLRHGDPTEGFRPDLEGLRAVAVVLVLLYHASVPGFAGGYVGVDVFFVLSGFLITGLLLREVRRTGSVSLPTFYARRARRLLPAAALVLLVTIIAAVLVMPALRVPDVAGDAASAALYVSNMRFAIQATDYLQADLAPSPILHFWSLSVEEQFYVFWPAIVLLVARARGDFDRRIGIVAVCITVVSLALSVWLTQANAPWAFFSLPTRAWELGLGASLAISAAWLRRIPERPAAIAAWAGLAMVAISGVLLNTETPFPGVAALLPTIGSALVIAGGFRQAALAPGRWLSMAIPRFLGRISYSLYLWHWPLLILPAVALDARLPWWSRGALVLVAIVLAAITQRWVEDPIRHGRGIGTLPRRNLAMAGALSLVVATVSLGLGAQTTIALHGSGAMTSLADDEAALDAILAAAPGRPVTQGGPMPPGLRPALDDARKSVPMPYTDGCEADRGQTEVSPCLYGDLQSATTVVLLGDSHGLAWFPTVERLATEHAWKLVMLGKVGCHPADMVMWDKALNREYVECTTWREAAFRRIADERPDLVIVAGFRDFKAANGDASALATGADRIARWRAGMARTLERLTPVADHVVVIGDTPQSAFDLPTCVSAHPDDLRACATPVDKAVDARWTALERQAAALGRAKFVDPAPWVCPSSPCPAVIGKFLVFRDYHHMTSPFASALANWLGPALPIEVARR